MSVVNAADLRPGDRVDNKYEVLAVLGKGGMGIVVEALHLDLQERVALKFLLPEALHHEDTTARFLREARTVRRLKSEHIVKVIDVGRRTDSGEPYIAMELLIGRDLSAELATRGPLPVQAACSLLLQACDAIAEAHANRIIHRDIKPANLFLTHPQGDGRPRLKVLDFGIAKVLEAEGKGTQTKAMMGSALYMSPEQMRSSKTVDARADVWALGVTLYELLTGHTPFAADSIPALIFAITTDPPTPPRTHRPELPPALEELLLRCLDKDVEARVPTVAALAAALAPFADQESAGLALAIQTRALSGDLTLNQPLPRESAPQPLTAVPSPQASTALDLAITSATRSRPERSRRVAAVALLLGAAAAVFLFRPRPPTQPLTRSQEAPASSHDAPAGSAAPHAGSAAPHAGSALATAAAPPGPAPTAPAAGSPGSPASRPAPPTTSAPRPPSGGNRRATTPANATATPPKNGQLGTSVD